MPRDLDSSIVAALQADSLQMAIFCTLTFASGVVNIWSGLGEITWQDTTWTGLGDLLTLGTVEEGSTVEARGITVVISGLDATLLANCMADFQIGLPAAVYMGFYLQGSDGQSTLSPNDLVSWSGRMDQPTISVSGTEATIAINCENRLADMDVPSDRRYTIQDQQMTWSGDLGFQFVQALQQVNITWGQQTTTTPNI
jgi:hypothetical protein